MEVLFVSNSFVYFRPNNDVNLRTIDQFEDLARRGGHDVTTSLSDRGGANLRAHWEDVGYMAAQDEIRSGKYDVVILGALPTQMHDGRNLDQSRIAEFNTYAARFSNLVEANGGQLVMHTNWPGDWMVDLNRLNAGDPFGTDIQALYRSTAIRNDAALAPAGLAYSEAYKAITARYGNGDNGETAERILTEDEVHATALLSYMQANVFYWTVFNETPPSPSEYLPRGVSRSDAELMQSIAADAHASHAIPLEGNAARPTPPEPTPPAPTPPSSEDGTLAGRLWLDENGNNLEDAGEPGVSGTTVSLVRSGQVVDTTTTDSNGRYSFDNLSNGYYAAHFEEDANGRSFVRGNTGSNDLIDSDVWTTGAGGVGVTSSYLVNGSNSMRHADAGIEPAVSTTPTPTPPTPTPPAPTPPTQPGGGTLAGRYFNDENGNNREDAGETGVSGATISLVRGSQVVATTTTDGNGAYSFTGLSDGWYGALFETQAGRDFVRVNAANDDFDSDVWRTINGNGEAAKYQISSSRSEVDLDAGLVGSGNGGGTPTPPAPTPPAPTPPAGGGTLAGRYFNDANENGREDNGETGVAGATISLVRGSQVVETTTTDGNGAYSFTGLSDGWYGALFEEQTGREFSRVNVGGEDNFDSDVWRTINGNGEAAKYQISSTRSELDLDAGLLGTGGTVNAPTIPTPAPPTGGGVISGRMFINRDGDEFEDPNEPGVFGASVSLTRGGQTVATTRTGENGAYAFTGLDDGWYSVSFDEPDRFDFIRGNVGGNDQIDSDVWRVNGEVGVSSSYFVDDNTSMRHADAGVELANGAVYNSSDDWIL